MPCTICQKDTPYQHWELFNTETGDRLRIVPERGGLITSWVCNGREIFYLDQSRFKDSSKSVRGGMPILFPICGNLPDNKLCIDKSEYFINQHGFARDSTWNLNLLEDCNGVSLSLKEDKISLLSYPFSFDLRIELRVQKNILDIIAKVKNNSKKFMPFSLGYHPYFKIRDLSLLKIEGLPEKCVNQKNMMQEKTSFQLEKLAQGVDFISEPISSTKLIDQVENISIELKAKEPFLFNVVWTDPPRKMICLEPWTSPRYSLTNGDHQLILAPGKEKIIKCKILINDIFN